MVNAWRRCGVWKRGIGVCHHFSRTKPSDLHFAAAVEDSILGLTGPFQVAGIDALLMPPSNVPFRNRIRA